MKKTRGIDIISKRFSDFEKRALKEILDLKKDDLIYELASGKSNFSIILAFLNRKIISIDLNFEKTYWKLKFFKKLFSLENWKIEKRDISKMNYKDFDDNIFFVFAGRFLHYLKYEEAENLLKILNKKMKKGGKLFFSISGIDTDLAKNYQGKNIDIEKRFFYIADNLKNRFKIKEKVCFYKKEEVKKLFQKHFEIIECQKTAFGNINIIAQKK